MYYLFIKNLWSDTFYIGMQMKMFLLVFGLLGLMLNILMNGSLCCGTPPGKIYSNTLCDVLVSGTRVDDC